MARRWQFVAYALAAASTTGAVGVGCSVLTSYEGYGGADGNCPQRRVLPERPPVSSSKVNNAYVGAMKTTTFVFTKNNASVPGGVEYTAVPGYDIDGRCTIEDDLGSSPCAPRSKVVADQPGTGGDNSIGKLLESLLPSGQLLRSQRDAGSIDLVTDGIVKGLHGLVVRVDRYNGLANDDEVTVELFNVVGVNGKTDGTGRASFDGNDTFIVDAAGVTTGTTVSATKDERAYVRNGVLTASFGNEFALRFTGTQETPDGRSGTATVAVPLTRAVLVGPIAPTASGLRLTKATLTGRLLVNRVFEEVLNFGICPSLPSFPAVKQTICDRVDIASSPTRSKDLVCDAMSFAFQLDVEPAKLGATAPKPAAASLCPGATAQTCD